MWRRLASDLRDLAAKSGRKKKTNNLGKIQGVPEKMNCTKFDTINFETFV